MNKAPIAAATALALTGAAVAGDFSAPPVPQAASAEGSTVETTLRAFRSQLSLDCESPQLPEWLASSAVYEFPLDDARSLRVTGWRAVVRHLCELREAGAALPVHAIHVMPTLEPQTVFVQFQRASSEDPSKSVTKLAIVRMSGDRIGSYRALNASPGSVRILQSARAGANSDGAR